jgi:phosphoribosylanthranilate isomerase
MPDHAVFPFGLIQVAGVHDAEETRELLALGTDIVGLPLRLTVNEEDITEDKAAELSRAFPGSCCLITYLDTVEEIVSFSRFLEIDYVQLHGPVDPAIMPVLRNQLPHVKFIKSLVIGTMPDKELHATMNAFSPYVWAFITDTYDPSTGAEGATGLTHDWKISRELVEASRRPVILAGGLNPDNVEEAIMTVRPHGVDVHTGVENASGRKDPDLVHEFVKRAKAAFHALSQGT